MRSTASRSPPAFPFPKPRSSTTCRSTSSMKRRSSTCGRLKNADCEVTDVVDHGFIQSIYFTDPNGIALEASYWTLDPTGHAEVSLEDPRLFGDPRRPGSRRARDRGGRAPTRPGDEARRRVHEGRRLGRSSSVTGRRVSGARPSATRSGCGSLGACFFAASSSAPSSVDARPRASRTLGNQFSSSCTWWFTCSGETMTFAS